MLIAAFRHVSFGRLYLFSDGLCYVLRYVVRYRHQIVQANLDRSFPNLPSTEKKSILAGYYHHFSDLLLETMKGFTLEKEEMQRRFVYRNPEVFLPFFENKQSILLLGSHYGNWEWGVLSFPLAVRHQVVGIYKPLKNKILDEYLNRIRCRWGLQLAPMARAARAFVSQRDIPTIFVLIADQTPSDIKNAHWLNFLHQDTPFLHGADKLARQSGYPVFYFEIERTARGYYEVFFSEICPSPSTVPEGHVTACFAQRLEATIQKKPTDWLWSHRRWKRSRLRPAAVAG